MARVTEKAKENHRRWLREHHHSNKHDPEYQRRLRSNYLKHKYGITIEEYELMLDAQDSECALCDKRHSEKSKLCVDHCHDTGEVRGLLCRHCNIAIGKLGDNIEGLTRALNYLKGD